MAHSFHATTSGTIVPFGTKLASSGDKSKILNLTSGPSALKTRTWKIAARKPIFCIRGNRNTLSTFPLVVLRLSLSTVEETDVRRCRENGPPQAAAYRCAGCHRDSNGVGGGMRLAALPAAAATGGRSGSATPSAAGACRPWLRGLGRASRGAEAEELPHPVAFASAAATQNLCSRPARGACESDLSRRRRRPVDIARRYRTLLI